MNKENHTKPLSAKLWRLPATIALATGLFTGCDQEGRSQAPITNQPDKTALIESPPATATSEPTSVPTEAPTQTVSPTETPVVSYLEQAGFSIVSNTEETLKFRKDIVTFNFDVLAAAGGPEIPPEIDPVILYENITKRFEINTPVNIKLEFDPVAQRYFYRLENGVLIDQMTEEPIEYKKGSYLFPFPNDIVPAETFASADLVAWSRSGANTMEQLKLEMVEQDTQQAEQEPSYQLVVVSQAGPPNWAWQEPEEAITYPIDEEEIERLGLEVEAVEAEQQASISNQEELEQYVQTVSAELGRDLFLVPMSGEALADFPDQAWALIDYENKNRIGNVYFQQKQAFIRFYNQAGQEFNQPLTDLNIRNKEFTIKVNETKYSNPQDLFWETEVVEIVDLPESIELSQLPEKIYANIQEFLNGKEYPEDNKVVYESHFLPGIESKMGILQQRNKLALAQGIYLGIMTPEETRQLFKVYDQAAYLVWMGHTNIDGERIVLPYCIPLQQFDRQVVIRTSANPDHLYSDSLSNNARRVYNKPEQEEFIQTLEQYVGQYIYLNLFQRKEEGATYSAEQMQLANIKTTLVLEPPFNLDNPPSQAAAGNFGLSRYRMLEDKLEQIEAKSPIDLPIIKKGDDQIDSEIQPPLVFAFYVFSPNNN